MDDDRDDLAIVLVRVLAARPKGLRPGLSATTATDILTVLFSAELYHSLRTGRRWSAARTATFLHDLLTDRLLAG